MIRLFLAIASFLAVSVSGLWYGISTDVPLDDTAFENEPLRLEESSVAIAVPDSIEPTEPPLAAISAQEAAPGPASPSAEPTVPDLVNTGPISEGKEAPKSDLVVESRLLRFGYRVPTTSRTIDTIVLHSSYNALGGDQYSVDQTIAEYEQYGVGAHYLITRNGVILRLVEEGNIAYHAGASKMPDGRKNVNDFSIGIEMIATEESGYTEKQYAAVNALIADIKTRYSIESVVGHGDIAPTRKTDPWKFDWKKLQ